MDAENTIRFSRLFSAAMRYRLDVEWALSNVQCAHVLNLDHQRQLLTSACALMSQSRFTLMHLFVPHSILSNDCIVFVYLLLTLQPRFFEVIT
jgi:hypothetical protein